MNKLEADWATVLELERRAGTVLRYVYEGIKLKLADRCWYTPDFLVFRLTEDGGFGIELHEVKGHWEEDARVKWKVAAAAWPEFSCWAIKKGRKRDGGRWQIEVYRGQEETDG